MLKRTFIFLVTTITLFIISPTNAAELTPEQIFELGIDAYIYAYPLVLMTVTKDVSTNVEKPTVNGTRAQAPINQFANMAAFPTADFKDVIRPNADTLYSSAWLDLSKEPIILSISTKDDRYYLMPMFDAWSNVFISLSKRTNDTKSQNFVIVGPAWKGTLPKDLKEIKAPTNMVWILGRTQTNGISDYEYVHSIQSGYKLTPLSAWGQSYTPAVNTVNPNIDTETAPAKQVAHMDAIKFFTVFAEALKNNPPPKQDYAILAELRKIGIKPGKDFDSSQLSNQQLHALDQAIKIAQADLAKKVRTIGTQKNGWNLPPIVGKYGKHYLDRAVMDYAGLGANLPQDAVYPTAYVDDDNNALNGKYRYILHFDKNQLPSVNAFWSLAMYNPEGYFVHNPLNRYSIGDRDKLQFNQDGSLDIYIQHTSPGPDKESNWLPAPEGPFNLTLRLYWPKQSVLDGNWSVPGIKRIEAQNISMQ